MRPISDTTSPFRVEETRLQEFARRPESTDETWLVYCSAGEASVCIDTEEYSIALGSSLFVFPHKNCFVRNASPDFQATAFSFCREILDETVSGLSATLILYIRSHPKVELSNTDRSFLTAMTEQLRHMQKDQKQPYKNKIVSNLLSNFLLIHYGASSISETLPESAYKRSEELFKRFLIDIEICCSQSHNVSEYANRLCITPKHLTCIVRNRTGKSPKGMIEEALLRRTKSNLKNSPKSVKEISIECGFPNAAYFSRFFKRMTQMTPQEFRNKT